MARKNLATIPAGAVVAYTDATIKGAVARVGILIIERSTGNETEVVIDPGTLDVNEAEAAGIITAVGLGAKFVVADSLSAIEMLGGVSKVYQGAMLIFVPGSVEACPEHQRAHDLAARARFDAEQGARTEPGR
jgi:hypothetical protein